MINSKAMFEKFKSTSYFSRVDGSHPLDIFIGLDNYNRKAIELRAGFKPKKLVGTTILEVNQYSKSEYNTIRFSLVDNQFEELFYKFCDDLIESTRTEKESGNGYTAIIDRFYLWKMMFVSPKTALLSESKIMGLIGEILVLKDYIAPKIGFSSALMSWSGQELTHKDFSFNKTWIESKAIKQNSQNVSIASIEQLDSENDGELAIHKLEKMSNEFEGINLNDLVIETRRMFSSLEEEQLFISKVASQGYYYDIYYNDFVYDLKSFTCYRVNKDFPKLTRKSIHGSIKRASYEISIEEIKEFEINLGIR